MKQRACDIYSAHLQVGRLLKDPVLALVVVLRNLPLMILTLGFWDGTNCLAPSWVVVVRSSDGAVVYSVPAGRAADAGEEELAAVQSELDTLDVADFEARREATGSNARARRRRRKEGARDTAGDAVADGLALPVGMGVWWLLTLPFRLLIRAVGRITDGM